MTRRMFHRDPPRISFYKDGTWLVHGDLAPGKTVAIIYDADRLPHERSVVDGAPAWLIRAYYQTRYSGEVRSVDLWSETGAIRTKQSLEPGEGTMMRGRIDLPADADHLAIWFRNTGASGADYWDSSGGHNYVFRFVAEELEVESSGITRDPHAARSWFRVAVSAAAEVADLSIVFRVMNGKAGCREPDCHLPLTLAPVAHAAASTSARPTAPAAHATRRHWTGEAELPIGAVIRYTLHYNYRDTPHDDTNTGKGYLAWEGARRNLAAGVL